MHSEIYSDVGDFDPNDEEGASQSKSRKSGSRLSVFSHNKKSHQDKKRHSLINDLSSKRSNGSQNQQEGSGSHDGDSNLRSSIQDRFQTTQPVKELVEEEELLSARTSKPQILPNLEAEAEMHLLDEGEEEYDLEGSVYIDPSLMDSDKLSLSVASASRKLGRVSNRSHHESEETVVDLNAGKVLPLLIEGETAEILMEIQKMVELDMMSIPSL